MKLVTASCTISLIPREFSCLARMPSVCDIFNFLAEETVWFLWTELADLDFSLLNFFAPISLSNILKFPLRLCDRRFKPGLKETNAFKENGEVQVGGRDLVRLSEICMESVSKLDQKLFQQVCEVYSIVHINRQVVPVLCEDEKDSIELDHSLELYQCSSKLVLTEKLQA